MIVDPLLQTRSKCGFIQYPFSGKVNRKHGKTNATLRVKEWLKTDFILLKGETADSITEVGERSHAECCCAVRLAGPP